MTTSPAPATDPTLATALAYAELGLRVLPIKPGHKYPAGIGRWQDAATTDPATITAWWTGLYRGHGIGIATGPGSGCWVLDVDIAGDKRGDDTLHELEQTYGPLPDTVEAVTGSGGRHIYFAWDPQHPVRNDQSGRLGHGLDVRGDGGQVLAEPSIHPNGQPYTWVDGHAPGDLPVAHAPGWVYAYLERDQRPAATPTARVAPSRDTGDRPGDLWAQTVTWGQLLAADGWTHAGVGPEGEQRWVRPGKDRRDGISATVGYKGSDVLKVFTSSMAHAGLDADATYTKLGYLAATRYHGDHSAAATALRAAGHHAPAADDALSWLPAPTAPLGAPDGPLEGAKGTRHGWEPADVGSVLAADYEAPVPTVGERDGGGCLFYAGRTNALYAPSGTGKSWVAMWACAEALREGYGALYVDLEDHAASVLARMIALGIDPGDLAERFVYIAPEMRWNPRAADAIAQLVTDHDVTVAVIDSTGESMALDGVKPNDDDAVAVWFRALPRFLSRLGPAVILTDHVPKAAERPKGYAIGSQRKRAALDGLAYDVDARVAPAKGVEGHLGLTVAKDRNGTYQPGAKVADVHVASSEDGRHVTIRVQAPESGHRPTILMERVSRYLEEEGPQSKRTIEKDVQGRGPVIRVAVDYLAMEGYLAQEPGRNGGATYRSLRPFRSGEEGLSWTPNPVDNPTASTASQPRPPENGRGSEPHQIQPRPPRPPLSYKTGGTGTRLEGSDDLGRPPSPPKRVPPSDDAASRI